MLRRDYVMTARPAVARETFVASRASDYLTRRGLVSQTGQPEHRFADVVLKELVDNALDAADMVGAAPRIHITVGVDTDEHGWPCDQITVADNGPGIPERTIHSALDFGVLVSDKSAYRSCTRGLQGNALKTIFGVASSLRGSRRPVVIAAPGCTHHVAAYLDPAGEPEIEHRMLDGGTNDGTRVEVAVPRWPADAAKFDPIPWVRAFALVNPHATITCATDSAGSGGNALDVDSYNSPEARIDRLLAAADRDELLDEDLASSDADAPAAVSYKATVDHAWCKPRTSDPTSPHWYTGQAFEALVYSHINAAKRGGRDLPLGEFVRRFAGLTSTAKAQQVAAEVAGVGRLSDLTAQPHRIGELHEAMKARCRQPSAKSFGAVPQEHYQQLLDDWHRVRRFWFKRVTSTYEGCPVAAEFAVAETETPGRLYTAVNYSVTFDDPLGRALIVTGEKKDQHPTYGAKASLAQMDALPDWRNDYRRAAVIHMITPVASFLDKGKTTLSVTS